MLLRYRVRSGIDTSTGWRSKSWKSETCLGRYDAAKDSYFRVILLKTILLGEASYVYVVLPPNGNRQT